MTDKNPLCPYVRRCRRTYDRQRPIERKGFFMQLSVSIRKVALPVVGLVAALGIGAALSAAPALANEVVPYNTIDSSYLFNFSYFGDTQYTAARSKDTSTSTYVRASTNTTPGVYLYVDGYDGYTWNENLTDNTYGYLRKGQTGQYELHNTVYENGYRIARLRGMSNGAGVLAGEWSPDCAGSYTDLNW